MSILKQTLFISELWVNNLKVAQLSASGSSSHEALVKLSAGAAAISRLNRAEGSAPKLTHTVVGRL